MLLSYDKEALPDSWQGMSVSIRSNARVKASCVHQFANPLSYPAEKSAERLSIYPQTLKGDEQRSEERSHI